MTGSKKIMASIPENRSLLAEESELIRWLLSDGNKEAYNYLSQVDRARVTSRCGCGCASIDFSVDGEVSNLKSGMEELSDHWWRTPAGNLCGIFVFARDKKLAGLEVWSIDGAETPNYLPSPSELKNYDESYLET